MQAISEDRWGSRAYFPVTFRGRPGSIGTHVTAVHRVFEVLSLALLGWLIVTRV